MAKHLFAQANARMLVLKLPEESWIFAKLLGVFNLFHEWITPGSWTKESWTKKGLGCRPWVKKDIGEMNKTVVPRGVLFDPQPTYQDSKHLLASVFKPIPTKRDANHQPLRRISTVPHGRPKTVLQPGGGCESRSGQFQWRQLWFPRRGMPGHADGRKVGHSTIWRNGCFLPLLLKLQRPSDGQTSFRSGQCQNARPKVAWRVLNFC